MTHETATVQSSVVLVFYLSSSSSSVLKPDWSFLVQTIVTCNVYFAAVWKRGLQIRIKQALFILRLYIVYSFNHQRKQQIAPAEIYGIPGISWRNFSQFWRYATQTEGTWGEPPRPSGKELGWFGSIPFRLSTLFKCCSLWTLFCDYCPLQLKKHWNGSPRCLS